MGRSFSLHFPTGTSGLQSCVTPARLSWGRAFPRPGFLAPSCFTGGGAVLYPVGSLTDGVVLPTEIESKLSLPDFSVCPVGGQRVPPADENLFCTGHLGDRSQLLLGASHTETDQWPVRQGWAPGTTDFYRGWKLKEVLNLAAQPQRLRPDRCAQRSSRKTRIIHASDFTHILLSYKIHPDC